MTGADAETAASPASDFAESMQSWRRESSGGTLALAIDEALSSRGADPSAAFGAATSGGGGEVPYRAEMESAFGRDLGHVRAHTGADGLDGLGAEGAALGQTIAFSSANPSRELVAHELTHTMQGGAGSAVAGSGMKTTTPTDAAEHEAANVGAIVGAGGKAPAITAALPGPVVSRSFVSWAVKKAAKETCEAAIKLYLKKEIKDRLVSYGSKHWYKQLCKDADHIDELLTDPWWMTVVSFVPVVGDAIDVASLSYKVKKAIDYADELAEKGKWLERSLKNAKVLDKVPASLGDAHKFKKGVLASSGHPDKVEAHWDVVQDGYEYFLRSKDAKDIVQCGVKL